MNRTLKPRGQSHAGADAAVLSRLATYYPDVAPETVSIRVVRQRHAFAKSDHIKCLVRGRTQDGQWVRRAIYGKTDRLAGQEYANLTALWQAQFHNDMTNRIPRPLGYSPEHDLLLTEYLPGHHGLLPWLLSYISPLGRCLDRDAALARMERVADWLIAFQARAPTAGARLADVEEAIADLQATACFSPAARRRCAMWLERAGPVVAAAAPVASHGDFAARNILLGRRSVVVVDWEKPLVVRHPLYDAQTFVVNLERRLSYPLCSRRRVEELKQAFVNRYLARTCLAAPQQALGIIRIVVLIHQLRAQIQATGGHPLMALIKRRQPFIRYLVAEIERGVGLD